MSNRSSSWHDLSNNYNAILLMPFYFNLLLLFFPLFSFSFHFFFSYLFNTNVCCHYIFHASTKKYHGFNRSPFIENSYKSTVHGWYGGCKSCKIFMLSIWRFGRNQSKDNSSLTISTSTCPSFPLSVTLF